MMQMTEKTRSDLARSATAMGTIIEAHADERDVVLKVVVQLPEWVRNPEVRQSVAELWQEGGFIASVNAEGLLIIDGVKDVAQ